MLLIYCPTCQSIFQPNDKTQSCRCKNVKSDKNNVITGEHCKVGLASRGQFSFSAAVEQAKEGSLSGKFHGHVELVTEEESEP